MSEFMAWRSCSLTRRNICAAFACLAAGSALAGCGGVIGSNPASAPAPPPSTISVSVVPASMSVLLGTTAALSATVSNTTDTAVSWSVAGIPGGNSTVGTISASGVFTAPQFLPVPGVVTVQATSLADASKTATATTTVTRDIRITIAPPGGVAVELGGAHLLHAPAAPAGQPGPAVSGAVSGSTPASSNCPAAVCGTV